MQEHIVTQQERLTAFALNELDGPDRDAVSAQLKNDPAAQAYVESVRATATLLESELKQERLDELARSLQASKAAPAAPAAAKPAAAKPAPVRIQRPTVQKQRWRFVPYAMATAALVALGFVLYPTLSSERSMEMSATARSVASKSDSYEAMKNEAPRGLLRIDDGKKDSVQTVTADNLTPMPAGTFAGVSGPSDVVQKANIRDHYETYDLSKTKDRGSLNGLQELAESKVVEDKRAKSDRADLISDMKMGDGTISESKKVPAKVAAAADSGWGGGYATGQKTPSPESKVKSVETESPKVEAPIIRSVETIEALKNINIDAPIISTNGRPSKPESYLNKAPAPAAQLAPSFTVLDEEKSATYQDQGASYGRRGRGGAKDRPVEGLTEHSGYIQTPPAPLPPVVPVTPGETYAVYGTNGFESVRTTPLSTFSADVDTASYSNVRRFLTTNQLPPPDAVRVEELINYFKYSYDTIASNDPFGVNVEAAACPWNPKNRLVRVGIRAKNFAPNARPAGNFVFLIDVSGSMDAPNRLPLVKEGMKALVRKLDGRDRVSIVTYANESGVGLPATNCSNQERILAAIDALVAQGGTNGGAGIQMAYAAAKASFIKGGVNRVILATDGDFNVGITDTNELINLIAAQSSSGVFLTALGYGMGNFKDAMLQKLADKGNGNYAYIDNAEESRKVLVEQLNGTLVTIAKDVKFQVEFNPANAQAYRLIGYEKRALAAQDFNNDAKDAGEIGAGHTVTAFYEVIPANASQPGVDALKYQNQPAETPAPRNDGGSPELLTLKIRYKQPMGTESKKLEYAFTDKGASLSQATEEFRFGSAVALFGQLLKQSPYIQGRRMQQVIDLADDARGTDEGGYRREFIQLVRKAAELRGER